MLTDPRGWNLRNDLFHGIPEFRPTWVGVERPCVAPGSAAGQSEVLYE
ncbi:MAG: DUF4209 domain-containing protein [Phycisphaerae bacterium]|nr:DUF4209 domain-containing protein [Phycisphaerae bacterium]